MPKRRPSFTKNAILERVAVLAIRRAVRSFIFAAFIA